MEITLKYTDDNDRALGAAGMAVGIVVANAEELVEGLDLDLPSDRMMLLSDSFWLAGIHGSSVRSMMNQMVAAYRVTVSMAIANLLCRSIIGRSHVATQEERRTLFDAIMAEGHESCCLDDDEIHSIFDRDYNYMIRVFSHSGVQPIVRHIADELKERRRFSRIELIEALRPLSSL